MGHASDTITFDTYGFEVSVETIAWMFAVLFESPLVSSVYPKRPSLLR